MMHGVLEINSLAVGLNRPSGQANAPAELADEQNPFRTLLQGAIGQMGILEEQARAGVVGLMRGDGTDVHQAIIAEQKVQMAFELALSMRNKALQAYQSIMGMQF